MHVMGWKRSVFPFGFGWSDHHRVYDRGDTNVHHVVSDSKQGNDLPKAVLCCEEEDSNAAFEGNFSPVFRFAGHGPSSSARLR